MNARSAQGLTAALAALLVILVGATIFIILSRPSAGPSPTPSRTLPSFILPSPTPTTAAVGSPVESMGPSASAIVVTPTPFTPTPAASAAPSAAASASASPLLPSPSPSATLAPTPAPTLSPTPTLAPSPSPTPTPSATPTIVPTAPQRTLQLMNVGLDAAGITGNVPRTVTFNTDGPSTITASVANASGSVRVCLRQEPQLKGMCVTTRSGNVQQFTTDGGSGTWTASFIGKDASPTADLTIQFNASQPSATLDSFRWTGTSSSAYNGFDAQTDALVGGQISLQASFDDGSNGAYDWHLVIKPQGGAAVFDQSGGPDQTVDQSQNVGQGSYRVTFSDPDDVANPDRAVILTATLSWP